MSIRVPYSIPFFPARTITDVSNTFLSSYISGSGDALSNFESQLNARLNSEHCLLVSNGSAALRLAFLTLGLKPGCKVVLPAWGFHVAANIAYSFGAQLEFVDVDEQGWCLDAQKLKGLNLDSDSFLVLIHTLGNCSDLKFIKENFDGVRVIEDAAEALFSRYSDNELGTIFDAGTYSFHAAKTITTGEGGLVVFKSNLHFLQGKLFRSHGMTPDRPYFHKVAGDNLRLSNLLAAVGLGQMAELEDICKKRNAVYARYLTNLSSLKADSFIRPIDPKGFFPWGFALRIISEYGVSRQELVDELRLIGVETRPGFSSATELPYIQEFSSSDFPVADALSREVILLPHYPDLDLVEVDRICEVILRVLL